MKKILVHCHIFYPDKWPELKDCIANLQGMDFSLYVTWVQEYPEIRRQIEEMAPLAHIELVPNRGYDIAPFIHVLNQVELSQYDYLIKLHTKRDIPSQFIFMDTPAYQPYNFGGSRWRNYLLSFMQKGNLAACIQAFNDNPTLGMAGDFHCIRRYINENNQPEMKLKKKVLEHLRNSGLPTGRFEYICGTMFICRAELMQALKDLASRTKQTFSATNDHTQSYAHELELFCGACIVAQGYEILDVYTKKQEKIRARATLLYPFGIAFLWILRFLYQRKLTKSNHLIIKIFRIPFYHKNLNKH